MKAEEYFKENRVESVEYAAYDGEYKETISLVSHGLKEGMIVDFLLGDEWKIGYGTILYFDDNSGLPVVEMNYPGHDGCRWAHEYSLDSIRPSAL